MSRTIAVLIGASALLSAQPPQPPRPSGGFVPGQQRPSENPEVVARGKALYGLTCRGCHGADLRGGDMGGPNLLRSTLSLTDKEGEKIIPVIQSGLRSMPAFPMPAADAQAVAAFVRSVIGTLGGQGRPPSSQEPPSILVGNASEGKTYFETRCVACHSASGDLKGIATRIADPKMLQNVWVSGGAARRGQGPAPKPVTAKVTPTGSAPVEGRVVRIDDFLITLALADGSQRTFAREGDVPKVEVYNPRAGHLALLSQLSDKNMHDVTAYLVTLK